jgi:hypothetical protein
MKRYIASFPNVPGTGRIRELFYSNDAAGMAEAEAFARREDRPGHSVFDAVNLYRDDANSRNAETVAALICIHADIDLKDLTEDRNLIRQRILALPCQPTAVVDSGHGYHVYYFFREPIEIASEEAAMVRIARARLVAWLGADTHGDQDSALMRRPGTTNSKDPKHPVACTIIAGGPYYVSL